VSEAKPAAKLVLVETRLRHIRCRVGAAAAVAAVVAGVGVEVEVEVGVEVEVEVGVEVEVEVEGSAEGGEVVVVVFVFEEEGVEAVEVVLVGVEDAVFAVAEAKPAAKLVLVATLLRHMRCRVGGVVVLQSTAVAVTLAGKDGGASVVTVVGVEASEAVVGEEHAAGDEEGTATLCIEVDSEEGEVGVGECVGVGVGIDADADGAAAVADDDELSDSTEGSDGVCASVCSWLSCADDGNTRTLFSASFSEDVERLSPGVPSPA
jgi:hypothetical protein